MGTVFLGLLAFTTGVAVTGVVLSRALTPPPSAEPCNLCFDHHDHSPNGRSHTSRRRGRGIPENAGGTSGLR
ncbi:hypothetical protein SAMN05192584_108254 [Streptomyces pini]|uniref:Uncharacterized protein n=1 Tax=Streptomyces pini TaxID=1520580 RepID=A0A1I4C6C2_9ACTN|nr:hypothetical protein SAMN05192584_108254 [Streptomyces pini]